MGRSNNGHERKESGNDDVLELPNADDWNQLLHGIQDSGFEGETIREIATKTGRGLTSTRMAVNEGLEAGTIIKGHVFRIDNEGRRRQYIAYRPAGEEDKK